MAGKDPPVPKEDGDSEKPLEGVIEIVTNLTGVASKQIEQIAESISDDKHKGFERLIEALDRTFKYDERSSTMNVWNNHEPSRSSSTPSAEEENKR